MRKNRIEDPTKRERASERASERERERERERGRKREREDTKQRGKEGGKVSQIAEVDSGGGNDRGHPLEGEQIIEGGRGGHLLRSC